MIYRVLQTFQLNGRTFTRGVCPSSEEIGEDGKRLVQTGRLAIVSGDADPEPDWKNLAIEAETNYARAQAALTQLRTEHGSTKSELQTAKSDLATARGRVTTLEQANQRLVTDLAASRETNRQLSEALRAAKTPPAAADNKVEDPAPLDIKGVSKAALANLSAAGIKTVDQIRQATDQVLEAIEGIDARALKTLREATKEG